MENLFNNILFRNIRELENIITTIVTSSVEDPRSSEPITPTIRTEDIVSHTGSSFNYQVHVENNDRLTQSIRFLNNFLYSSDTLFNNLHNESRFTRPLGLGTNHSRQAPRFGISRYLDNERILHSRRYDENDYETAEIIYFELRDEWKQKNNVISSCDIDSSRSITISLKNILLDFYNNENEEERFPNLEEFLNKIFIFKCNCIEDYNQENINKILEYYCMFYWQNDKTTWFSQM
jgi:hypothetical protein